MGSFFSSKSCASLFAHELLDVRVCVRRSVGLCVCVCFLNYSLPLMKTLNIESSAYADL